MKKTYNQYTEEVAATSMSPGGVNVSQAAQTGSGHLSGIDLPFGTMKRRKKKNESFAGCPVFTVSNDDYAKCMHGRMRYERWNKKLNMEEIENQEIRSYAHKNPGKPIIVKDERYGTMSYFISPKQEVSESVEKKPKNMTPEAMFAFWKTLKSRQEIDIWFDSGIAKGTNWKTFVVGRKSKSKKYNSEKISLTPKGGRGKFYLFNRQGKVSLAIGDMGASLIAMRKSTNESVELDEHETKLDFSGEGIRPSGGKYAIKLPKSAEKRSERQKQIIRQAMANNKARKTRPLTNPMKQSESVEVDEGLNLKSFIHDVQKKMKMTEFDRKERARLKELKREIHWYNTKILGISESVELDEGKTEFAVAGVGSGMFIKAFSTEKIARQYIKNQYRVRKKLKGKLGIIEVPLGADIVSNQMKRFGKIKVVKESAELDEWGVPADLDSYSERNQKRWKKEADARSRKKMNAAMKAAKKKKK